MKAKVLSEKYQVSYRVEVNGEGEQQNITEDVDYKDAYWRAFQVAGTHRCPVSILRVTTVETSKEYRDSAIFSFLDDPGDVCQVVTGSVTIDAEHFARDVNLSRYHPNNGWDVPDYIEIDFGDAIIL